MTKYSDNDRATALAALDANGGNVKATARQTGIPIGTIRHWRATEAGGAELRTQKKVDLASELEAIALRLVAALPDKIGDASLQQVATSLGIAVDKMQLLRGQPTVRTATSREDYSQKSDDELYAIIADAERIARTARGG